MSEYTGNCSENYEFVIIEVPKEFHIGMTECLSGDVLDFDDEDEEEKEEV